MRIRVLGTKAITDVLEMKGQRTGVVSGARRDVIIFLGPSTAHLYASRGKKALGIQVTPLTEIESYHCHYHRAGRAEAKRNEKRKGISARSET